MMGLNNFGTTITILTAVTLTALAVEILYVLWKRRLKLRPRVRAEPQEQPSLPSSSPDQRERELEEELEQHIAKWQCINGLSRVLFTIKEEDREGVDSESGSLTECSVVTVKKALAVGNTRLSEIENENVVMGDDEVVLDVEELLNETTPYSTPYYTLLSSPTRCNE
ncbi:unnamed protein product [Lathyrus sativus]|nr:unnamed protein product [Lathyrus sativus]